MLAIQRPNGMGSSQPSEADRPFGYSFDPSAAAQHDFLAFMDPPEPAPGQPLLSDNDSKLLGNFFESIEDNFTFEGLNFSEDWLNLPPQFMGHTTSFGQHPSPALGSPVHGIAGQFPDIATSSVLMPPPPPPTQPTQPSVAEQQASADVLAAATLLQTGSMSRSSANSHDGLYTGRSIQSSLGPPVGHLRHQPISEFRQEGRRISQSQLQHEHDNTFTDMMFGSVSRPAIPRAPPVEVQWGSDASFGRHQSYVPQSAKETSEALINEHLSYMECLEVSNSASNTRPSSPLRNGDASPLRLKTRNPLVKQEDDADAPPRKRRKSKARDYDDDDDEEPQSATTQNGSKTGNRKRKPKAEAPEAQNDAAGRRRKSTAAGASKQPRENLSEEQKRENHIKSEQKRRTVIKEGFDDLCDLVPGLKGGGFSKSTMLAMTAEWLEEMLQGNQILRKQLDAIEGR